MKNLEASDLDLHHFGAFTYALHYRSAFSAIGNFVTKLTYCLCHLAAPCWRRLGYLSKNEKTRALQ